MQELLQEMEVVDEIQEELGQHISKNADILRDGNVSLFFFFLLSDPFPQIIMFTLQQQQQRQQQPTNLIRNRGHQNQ